MKTGKRRECNKKNRHFKAMATSIIRTIVASRTDKTSWRAAGYDKALKTVQYYCKTVIPKHLFHSRLFSAHWHALSNAARKKRTVSTMGKYSVISHTSFHIVVGIIHWIDTFLQPISDYNVIFIAFRCASLYRAMHRKWLSFLLRHAISQPIVYSKCLTVW